MRRIGAAAVVYAGLVLLAPLRAGAQTPPAQPQDSTGEESQAAPPESPAPPAAAPDAPAPPASGPPPASDAWTRQSYAPPPPGYGPPPVPLPDGAHYAQPGEVCYPAPPPGQTHDGFYARLHLGGGYMSARTASTAISGGQVGFGFALGAIVVPDLALFGSFYFHFVDDPAIKVNGVSMPIAGSSLENDSFAAGLAYYIEPMNAYLSASISGTTVDLYDKNMSRLAASNTGAGFQLMAGEEWWVGREWGVGVAGEITGAWMKDSNDSSVRWTSFSYTLAFSATYN